MKAKIVITLEGDISIVTQEGSFDSGKAKIEALLEALGAAGLDLQLTDEIEQHRHDEPGQIKQQNHAH